jgi:hypothetical protein
MHAPLFPRALAAVLMLCSTPDGVACGFHEGIGLARSALNLAYPDALHVHTAVWMAQLEGVVAKADPATPDDGRPEALRALAAYRDAAGQLGLFRDLAGARLDASDLPAFTVVLVGPMLWTRFERHGAGLAMAVHVSGPVPGDVVVVTDRPVVAGLVAGTLTPRSARERGLIRYYGEPERVRRIAALVDRLSPDEVSTR